MPREDKFFDLFSRHAQSITGGAEALRTLLEGGPGVAACCAKIVQYEHEADTITRDVMLAVRRTFITPFDRGDIQALITSMDDAIDQMQKTAKTITMFEVTSFEPLMREMGDVVVESSKLVPPIVAGLRDMRSQSAQISALTERMTNLEEQSDQLHDKGIRELFRAHRNEDPMAFIVGSEILRHLEHVVDRFEDIANRVNAIVVEHI